MSDPDDYTGESEIVKANLRANGIPLSSSPGWSRHPGTLSPSDLTRVIDQIGGLRSSENG